MKKILILIIPFLITGCAVVDYNLEIEKDLSVVETVNISATKEYFDNFYKNLPITIVKQSYEYNQNMSILNNNNYTHELKRDNKPFPSVFVTKKYNNLEEYANQTIFKGQSIENIKTWTNDNLITIKTEGFYRYAPDDSGEDNNRFPISDLAINIKLPYVVVKSNADKINRKTNTYTWLINEKTEDKVIDITFDKTRIYVYNLFMYISMVILGIIIIIGIVIILRMRKKNKLNNDV